MYTVKKRKGGSWIEVKSFETQAEAVAYLTEHGHAVIGKAEYKNFTDIIIVKDIDGTFKSIK